MIPKEQFTLTNSVYRCPHDKNSADHHRNLCANRIDAMFTGVGKSLNNIEVYPSSLEELVKIIDALPSEKERLNSESTLLRKDFFLSRERVMRTWLRWHENFYAIPRRHLLVDSQWKRFAMHLGTALAMEAFLKSDAKYFFKFEDDVYLHDDFLERAKEVTMGLPEDWDVFNFIVPIESQINFQQRMRLGKSNISQSYQHHPAACLLYSRSGAAKLLYEIFEEDLNLPMGNRNIDISGDHRVHNFRYIPPFVEGMLYWHCDYSGLSRKFQTYTFAPESTLCLKWREGNSTWIIGK